MAKSGGGVTVTVSVVDPARLPEIPLTVNWETLAAAVLVAVSVSVLFAAVLAGLNDAVTPAGRPVAVKATVPLKPVCGATVIVALPVLPGATFTLGTEEESLKPGAAATAKAIAACAEIVPDVAVMVTVAGPTSAGAVALSFSVLAKLPLAGVNVAVTPVGKPPTVRVGAPVKPFSGVTVMVLVPDPPCVTLKLAGEAPNVKLAPAFTVRLNVTDVDDVPEVPSTVTVVVPTAAADVALNVATLVLPVEAGLNDAVTPAGRPGVVNATLPVKPFFGTIVIVIGPLAPCTTLSVGADAVIEKAAGAATVKAMVTVALRLPDLPVTVTVAVPMAAPALATKLNVLVVAVLAGLNDALTPLGKPEIVRLTVPLNPLVGAMAIEAVPVVLWMTARVDADVVKL
jgi:hypothetical protein